MSKEPNAKFLGFAKESVAIIRVELNDGTGSANEAAKKCFSVAFPGADVFVTEYRNVRTTVENDVPVAYYGFWYVWPNH